LKKYQRTTTIIYSLFAVLVASGIAYLLVANSEYSGYKNLASVGMKANEIAEEQFEISFFIVAAAIYFGLCTWVLKSRNNRRRKVPYIASIAVSSFLIVAYIASRTLGVPTVGVEYYVGSLDILTKILQGIATGLSCAAIISMKKQQSIAAENRSTIELISKSRSVSSKPILSSAFFFILLLLYPYTLTAVTRTIKRTRRIDCITLLAGIR
jgi:hypothetical protein